MSWWLRGLSDEAGAAAVVIAVLALLMLWRLIGLAAGRFIAAARLRDAWERLWMR